MRMYFDTAALIDTHCHLNEESYDADRGQVVDRAEQAGLELIIDIAVDVVSSRRAIENAKAFPEVVKAAVGIDMENLIPGSELFEVRGSESDIETEISELRKLIAESRELIAMIGETGIDLYWLGQSLKSNGISQSDYDRILKEQENLLRRHIDLALEFNLPLSIHSRGAEWHTLQVITDYIGEGNVTGIFHSFTGTYEEAYEIIDCGFALGVNGIITFKNAEDLREVYRKLLGKVSTDWSPADFYKRGVFFETDGPYLSPQGKRGERNEPANVKDIYEYLISNI